jgi:hypothetical protein
MSSLSVALTHTRAPRCASSTCEFHAGLGVSGAEAVRSIFNFQKAYAVRRPAC